MQTCRLIGLGLFLTVVLGPLRISACNVPVFRYALEWWNPDPYITVVFHRGPLTIEQQSVIEAIEKTSQDNLANLIVRKVDVSKGMAAPFQALWQAQAEPSLPWMVVRYPAQTGIEMPVWTGPLSQAIAKTLVDSPARREIARRLIEGDSAVWLLLESDAKKEDAALARTLENESRKLEQALELPKPAPEDPPITLDLPLNIAFSTVRVARSDPAERLLVAQLLNWNPNLKNMDNALLFPVFGRGRVLPPAMGDKIGTDVIGAIARILTGPCSCQIKEMNAGFDLLLAAKWDALFEGRELKSLELPPLVGMSGFTAAAANQGVVASGKGADRPKQGQPVNRGSAPPSLALVAANAVSEPVERDHLVRNLAVVGGIGVAFLAAMTWILKARSNRPPNR